MFANLIHLCICIWKHEICKRYVSANHRLVQSCWVWNRSEKQLKFLSTSRGTFLASLPTSHPVLRSGEEVENILANQRPGQPSWISSLFKKIQHFFRTPRGKIIVSLVDVNAMVLKKLKMCKVYNIRTDARHFWIIMLPFSKYEKWSINKDNTGLYHCFSLFSSSVNKNIFHSKLLSILKIIKT